MFGFISSKKNKPQVGGEIHQEKVRRTRITFTVIGIIIFILLNVLFYYMTRV